MSGKSSAESTGRHAPVMLAEALACLDIGRGRRYIDGTFGAGGYSRAILENGGLVLAIDRDRSAIHAGRDMAEAFDGRLVLVEGRISDIEAHAAAHGFQPADGVVLDVGVSSMQLDAAERGFSFRHDGPLDMRMGIGGADAAAIVNGASEQELATILRVLGEERHARRIARAIVKAREAAPITRTGRLSDVVSAAAGPPHLQRIHPATRTFQALRIFVNHELEELAEALGAAERVLREGGRLVVVAFHSLEDRIVKRFLQDRARASHASRHAPAGGGAAPTFTLLTRGALTPGEAELAANPRARSARLRAARRTAAPALAIDIHAIGAPRLGGVRGPEAYA